MAPDTPTMARPTARDVHVGRSEVLGDADRHVASLSPGEHGRLERLCVEQRDRFAISHGAIRQVLGAYLGCAPADVPLESLGEATLSPAELRQFLMTPSEDQPRAWLRSWVRKEAVLKARREGLGDRSLCELDVSDDHVGELVL